MLAAIAAGPRTPAALVDILYTPVDPRLRGAAERNVLAHLLKLRAEGRATTAGRLLARGLNPIRRKRHAIL